MRRKLRPVEPEKVGKGLIFFDFSVVERVGDLDSVILGYPRGLCDENYDLWKKRNFFFSDYRID